MKAASIGHVDDDVNNVDDTLPWLDDEPENLPFNPKLDDARRRLIDVVAEIIAKDETRKQTIQPRIHHQCSRMVMYLLDVGRFTYLYYAHPISTVGRRR